MATAQRSVAVAIFSTRDEANRAVDELQRAGFSRDQIGVVARDAEGQERTTGQQGEESHAKEGAVTGAAVGAGAAALVSLGMSFGAIPVIGPILAVGPLAAALLSAVGGAAAGGLAGGLIGWGIPEEEAKYYESEVQAGHYMVTVKADGRYDEAWNILRRCGGYSRDTATTAATTATPVTAQAATTTHAGEQKMQLREEELHAHKEPVQTGEVRVGKEVITEHKQVEVPVQKEEVVIQRHPASGQPSTSDIKPGEEIRIPVKEEQVHVEKTPVVTEVVEVGKRTVQDTEQVTGTVRKEQAKIEKEGDVTVQGQVPGSTEKK